MKGEEEMEEVERSEKEERKTRPLRKEEQVSEKVYR